MRQNRKTEDASLDLQKKKKRNGKRIVILSVASLFEGFGCYSLTNGIFWLSITALDYFAASYLAKEHNIK